MVPASCSDSGVWLTMTVSSFPSSISESPSTSSVRSTREMSWLFPSLRTPLVAALLAASAAVKSTYQSYDSSLRYLCLPMTTSFYPWRQWRTGKYFGPLAGMVFAEFEIQPVWGKLIGWAGDVIGSILSCWS